MPTPIPDSSSASLARPRSRKKNDLPANLYEPRAGYFVYRNPENGKTYTLGRISRGEARDQAIEANRTFEQRAEQRLINRLHAQALGETFSDWLNKYAEVLKRRNLADNTMRQHKWRIKTMEQQFGAEPFVHLLETRHWAEWLDTFTEQDKTRSAIAWRSWLLDCFNAAIAAGWVDRNPIEPIRAPTTIVKRDRLSLEAARAIICVAREQKDQWIARSIELALITAQRREDIASLQFRKRDAASGWVESDSLYVTQQKTGARLAIPLTLAMPEIGMTLGDAIDACRDHIASRWLIHQTNPHGNSPAGSQIWRDTITRRFADMRDEAARRSETPLWRQDKEPPSFHELRSLSLRLHTARHGKDFAQALAGHKDARTTDTYRDIRGSEWVKLSTDVFKTP